MNSLSPDLDVDVGFGSFDAPLPDDWFETLAGEQDPDDEELAETPADVIGVLGFDPLNP